MQLHSSLEYRHGETVIVLYAGHVWRPLSHCLRVKSDDRAHYNNMYLADGHISSPRLFVSQENIYIILPKIWFLMPKSKTFLQQ